MLKVFSFNPDRNFMVYTTAVTPFNFHLGKFEITIAAAPLLGIKRAGLLLFRIYLISESWNV